MTGYSGGKKRYGHPVGLAPTPKSMVELARQREQEIERKLLEERKAKERTLYYSIIVEQINRDNLDVVGLNNKHAASIRRLRKKAEVPESRLGIEAEKVLERRLKIDIATKGKIKKIVPGYLAHSKTFQELYMRRSEKKIAYELRGLINLYFILYQDMDRKRLQPEIQEFIKAMGEDLFLFHYRRRNLESLLRD